MIRLPKKIKETILRELAQEYSVESRLFIDSPNKHATRHLVVLRVGCERRLVILSYWGDGSYSFLAGYANMIEVKDELAYQVRRMI